MYISGKGNTLEYIAQNAPVHVEPFLRLQGTTWDIASTLRSRAFRRRHGNIIVRSDLTNVQTVTGEPITEDSLGFSFAGLLESRVVHSDDSLHDAFGKVRRSLQTENVQAYAQKRDVSMEDARIDYIVMKLCNNTRIGSIIQHPHKESLYLIEIKGTVKDSLIPFCRLIDTDSIPAYAKGLSQKTIQKIIEAYTSVTSLPLINPHQTYQMEFGITDDGHISVFQLRPFKTKYPAASFAVEDIAREYEHEREVYRTTFALGITPKEGIVLPVNVGNTGVRNAFSPYNQLISAARDCGFEGPFTLLGVYNWAKSSYVLEQEDIQGEYAVYMDSFRPYGGIDLLLRRNVAFLAGDTTPLLQSHDMFRLMEESTVVATGLSLGHTPGTYQFMSNALVDRAVRIISNGVDAIVMHEPS